MGGATGASGTAHPFTGYNKKEIKTALVVRGLEVQQVDFNSLTPCVESARVPF